jgi:HK97 family phage portal protein
MLERYPQGRVASWLGRTLGRIVPSRVQLTPPGLPSPLRGGVGGNRSGAGIATKSLAGPYFAFDRLGEPAWAPRDYAAFAREGFMRNAILYRSVRMIAEAAASVPLLLYSGDEEIAEHPLLALLARPNAASTAPDLLEALYGFLLVSGNAYLEALPLGQDIRELHTLRPDRIKVVPGADGWPEAFEYTVDGRTRRLPQEAAPGVRAVLHLKLFHPLNDHYGLSPIEAAASAIDIHNTASRWNKALLDNSARPSGALVYTARDGNLTIEQYDRLKAELEQGFQGAARAGRPLLLEGGLDWKSMSLSPKDMDFIEAKHVAAREIALALGVPPMLLGIPGDNTYSNYQEATRTFWRSTVLPLVNRTAKSLSCWLAPAYADLPPLPASGERAGVRGSDRLVRGSHRLDAHLELRPDIDSIEALSTEREALWTRVDKATFLTQNEKRAAVGYGLVDGGDELKGSDPSCRRRAQTTGLTPSDNLAAKFNPYHDAIGRFTTADGAADGLVHTVARRRGSRGEGTPAQEARYAAARAQAQAARDRVRELDPDWREPQSALPRDSIDGQIRHEEAVARAAEARIAELQGSAPAPISSGVTIRNQALAGSRHPDTGVPFDSQGFPIYDSVAARTVRLPHTGTSADYRAANRAAGLSGTPEGMTWHHHQDGHAMQLVPRDIHQGTAHTGSIGIGNLPGRKR